MPGGESLRLQQYYAYKHNAFWKIMGELLGFSPELEYQERLTCLRMYGVALWDVLQSCHREGSLDSSIRNPVPNEIPRLLDMCPDIRKIVCNGRASGKYLLKYFPNLKVPVEILPSTSPAAAVYSYTEKLNCWKAAVLPTLSKV